MRGAALREIPRTVTINTVISYEIVLARMLVRIISVADALHCCLRLALALLQEFPRTGMSVSQMLRPDVLPHEFPVLCSQLQFMPLHGD